MKKICVGVLLIFVLAMLAGCGSGDTKTIKIAVMGDPEDFYPCFEDGIVKAVSDVNSEYADSGYCVECEFYNDNGSYEQGAAIIDALAADESVTAVIGSVDMDINKTAAYVFQQAGKLFAVPYFLYDSVYQNNHYSTVFSLSSSAQTVGIILRVAAAELTEAKRWVVCAADGEFARSEMNGFLQCEYGTDQGMTVVDCVSMSTLENNFDETYQRWETLGVEGVILFPKGDEGFELLKKLKSRNPALVCGGDTAFDNSTLMQSDPELLSAMTGFIMAAEFMTTLETAEQIAAYMSVGEAYYEETGNDPDEWYFQGYNTVRMIADTAIGSGTNDPLEIAELLHENGYVGLCEEFYFQENGELRIDRCEFDVVDENGLLEAYAIQLGG